MSLSASRQQGQPKSFFRLYGLLFSVLLLTFHLCATPSHAAQASLTWSASNTRIDGTAMTNLAGYKIYKGSSPGSFYQVVDAGNVTSYTWSSLADATTYYFALSAYDTNGVVSVLSNEMSFTTPAAPPPAPLFAISASAGTGGTITPAGIVAVSHGLSQSFSIVPTAGYSIARVTVDGASMGALNSYTFTNVTANHTIQASFAATLPAPAYTISASAGTGGTITPSGNVTVSQSGSQLFSIVPTAGYSIAGVTVDGASVGALSSYTFSNVTANHTIQASFSSSRTSSALFAVNSGGASYISSSYGIIYEADRGYSGGTVGSTSAAISGTLDGTLYQSARYGDFTYKKKVSKGNHIVTLKFAELAMTSVGQRVFSVRINGTTVISNLDIYAKVGKNAAYDVVIPVKVPNSGSLSIAFVSPLNTAQVNAILVQ